MKAAPWVPLETGRLAQYHPTRVKGWAATPVLPRGDLTNIWLAP
jgi:hypothetical protein